MNVPESSRSFPSRGICRPGLLASRIPDSLIKRLGLSALVLGVGAAGLSAFGDAPVEQPPVSVQIDPSAGQLALGYAPSGASATDRLIEAAQTAVRTKPADPRGYQLLARMLLRKKRESADASLILYAEDAIAAARSRGGDDVQSDMLTLMIMQEQHRFADARDMARTVIERRADDPTGHLLLGDALLELGDYQQASEVYQHAMDLRPDLRSYNRGAYLRWLHGDIEGAVELLGLALDAGSARDPESLAWCYVDLGTLLHRSGSGRSALEAAERALKMVPDYLPALSLQGRAYEQVGKRDEAIAALGRAVERHPLVADLLLLSELLDAEGATAKAAERLAQAEKLASHDPRPLALYYARHDIKTERALELSATELAARRNIEAYDARALALLRAGRLDEAEEAIERATRLGTPNAELHLHRGLIDLARGERAAAKRELKAALDLDPQADPVLLAELSEPLLDS
jgi:tetratricopeptide (TPR) repeat protein